MLGLRNMTENCKAYILFEASFPFQKFCGQNTPKKQKPVNELKFRWAGCIGFTGEGRGYISTEDPDDILQQ